MPDQVYLILGLLLGLTLFFIICALRLLFRRRWLSTAGCGLSAALFGACFTAGILLLANIYTYRQFTAEQPVAELHIQRLGAQRYEVHLHDYAHNLGRRFVLQGDAWQLDARILKWKSPALWLGFKTLYRLERLSGRYHQISDEHGKPRSLYNLSTPAGLELWSFAQATQSWLPLLDSYYGNAAYAPLAHRAQFKISIGTQGLIVRPGNAAATQALQHWD